MRRVTPTAQELELHANITLAATTPEARETWKNSPVTAGALLIIERIRMECIEQAELLPEDHGMTILMAQAQIMSRLAEELSTTITETAEYDTDKEDPEDSDDIATGRPPPRRRAHFTP